MSLPPRQHYTADQLFDMARDDQQRDAIHAEGQACNGPFYPDRGITAESLLAYAAECRAAVAAMDEGAKRRYIAQSVLHVLRYASPAPLPI